MTDKFRDRVADLSGHTASVLDEVSEKVYEAGLLEPSDTLRSLSAQHKTLQHDCLVETQPVDTLRFRLSERVKKDVDELHELAADFLAQGKPGHDKISEAADILEDVLKIQ